MADRTLKVFEERDQMRKRVEQKLGWCFDQLEWHLEFEEIKQLLLERYPELSEEFSSPSPTFATPSITLNPMQAELGRNCEALLVFDKMAERNVEQEPEKKEMLQGGEEKSEHTIVEFQSPAKTTVNSPNTFELFAPPLLFESPPIPLFSLTKPPPIFYAHKLFDLMPESTVFLSNKLIPDYSSHDPYYRSFLLDIPLPRPPLRPPLQPLDLTQVYSQPPGKFNQQIIQSPLNFYAHKLFVLMPNSSIIFSKELSQEFSPHNPHCHNFSIYLPPPRPPSQRPDSFPFHKNPPTSSPYWQELCVLFDQNFIHHQFYGSTVNGNWYKSVKKKEDMNENYVNFERVVQVKRAVKEFSTEYFPQGKPTVRFMIGNFREVVTAIEELVGCPNASINTGKFIEQSASSSFSSSGLLGVTSLPSFAFKVLCSLLTHEDEGLFKEAYALVAEVVKKLVVISQTHCHPFITERANVVQDLIKFATDELHLFGEAEKTLLSTTSPHEAEILLVLHALSLEASLIGKEKNNQNLPEKERDAFLPQEMDINASLLEKTFSLVLKVSSLVDFDSKRAHFSSVDDHHLPQKQKVVFGIEYHKRETRFRYSHSLFPVLEVEALVTSHWVAREGHYSLGLVAYENTAEYLGQFNIEIYFDYCFTSYVCLFEDKFDDLPPTPLQLEEDFGLLGRAQVKCGLVIKLGFYRLNAAMHDLVVIMVLGGAILEGVALGYWNVQKFAMSEDGHVNVSITLITNGEIKLIEKTMRTLISCLEICFLLKAMLLIQIRTPGLRNGRFGQAPATLPMCNYQQKFDMLAVVLSYGAFWLYQMTVLTFMVFLSISRYKVTTAALKGYKNWLMSRWAKLGQLLGWEWPLKSHILKQQGYYLNYLIYFLNPKFLVSGADDNKVKEWAELLKFWFVTFTEQLRKSVCKSISSHVRKVLTAFLKANGFTILWIYSLNAIVGFIKPVPFQIQWIIAWSMSKWELKNYALLLMEVEIMTGFTWAVQIKYQIQIRSLRTRIILSSRHCHVCS